MRLSSRRLIILSASMVSILVVATASPAIAALFGGSPSDYATSFTVATGLNQPYVFGFSSGLVFFTQVTASGTPGTIAVETLNPSTRATSSIASYSGNGIFAEFFSNDSSGNIYYGVLSLSGEQIVQQAKSGSGYSSPTTLYQDSICPEADLGLPNPCPADNSGGIESVAADPAGNVFFAEVSPTGTATIQKLPAGDYSDVQTLFTLPNAGPIFSGITALAYSSGKLFFLSTAAGSTSGQLSSLDTRTNAVTTLLSAPNEPTGGLFYLTVGPSAKEREEPQVYYLYRFSRGPTSPNGNPSGQPPAEIILGGFPVSAKDVPSDHSDHLPGEIASETLAPPESLLLFFPSQGLLQASPSGGLFFMSFPYSSGGFANGAINTQWFNPDDSRFSEVASFPVPDSTNGAVGNFAIDSSGNIFVSTGGSSIMEIPSSSMMENPSH